MFCLPYRSLLSSQFNPLCVSVSSRLSYFTPCFFSYFASLLFLLSWCYLYTHSHNLSPAFHLCALSEGACTPHNEEFMAIWCRSLVENTLFGWGSNWELKELKNKVLAPRSIKLNTVPGHFLDLDRWDFSFYHQLYCPVCYFVMLF